MGQPGQAQRGARLEALLGFLQQTPDNPALLADAALTAYDEGDLRTALDLISRHKALEPIPPAVRNVEGLITLQTGRFDVAEEAFASLLEAAPDSPELKLNLAWAKIARGDYAGCHALVSAPPLDQWPQAAVLRVQALHGLGRLEEALTVGEAALAQRPDDERLSGALSTAALDAGDLERARRYAERAGGATDGVVTRGLLALQTGDASTAETAFSAALSQDPRTARAQIGLGLLQMSAGRAAAGAKLLRQGAETFGTHLGSWVAAGWAEVVAGDLATARSLFEKALSLDGSFSETHGALAVLDVLEGRIDDAERRTKTALRLDRQCFSAALAKSLILEGRGRGQAAERVRQSALNTPISPGGPTLIQAMAMLKPRAGDEPAAGA